MKKATFNLTQIANKVQSNQLMEGLKINQIKGGIHSDPPPFLSDNL